jgi:hypothetical protein
MVDGKKQHFFRNQTSQNLSKDKDLFVFFRNHWQLELIATMAEPFCICFICCSAKK